jgi:hypothetical protein
MFSKYSKNDGVKENEIQRTCSTNEGRGGYAQVINGKAKIKEPTKEEQDAGGWIILRSVLERLRTGTFGWLLCIR